MLRIFIFVSMGQISCNFQWSKSKREKALGVEERRYAAFQTQIMTPWKVNMRLSITGYYLQMLTAAFPNHFFRLSNISPLYSTYFFRLLIDTRFQNSQDISADKKKSRLKPLTVQTITWTLFTFANTTDADWLNQPLIIFTTKILFDEESWPFTIKEGELTTSLSHSISKTIKYLGK